MTATYSITTLGCKVNQYEINAIAEQLVGLGLHPAPAGQPADLAVIHTCCVTTVAMRKSRQAIRRAIRQADRPVVLVTGCYIEYDARRVREVLSSLDIPGSRQVLIGHQGDLALAVRRAVETVVASGCGGVGQAGRRSRCPTSAGGYDVSDTAKRRGTSTGQPHYMNPADGGQARLPASASLPPLTRFGQARRQRAFVKVQDGCDANCTYCIVCKTRRQLWSRPIEDILDECEHLVHAGHREIVLCGIFLGAFGRSSAHRNRWPVGAQPLARLVDRVARLPGLWRVRLSSLEPGDVTDELLEVFRRRPRVAPHLHLPIQSGSDRLLRRMNRQYRHDDVLDAVGRLRQTLDDPAISTDIIVGFPGEGESDFQQTLDLLAEVGVCKVHAFPFSPIRGTPAWDWRDDMPRPDIVKDRLQRLGELEAQLADAFRRQRVGQTVEAVVEHAHDDDARALARTGRYQLVRFDPPPGQAAEELVGQVVRLRITDTTPDGLLATIEPANRD